MTHRYRIAPDGQHHSVIDVRTGEVAKIHGLWLDRMDFDHAKEACQGLQTYYGEGTLLEDQTPLDVAVTWPLVMMVDQWIDDFGESFVLRRTPRGADWALQALADRIGWSVEQIGADYAENTVRENRLLTALILVVERYFWLMPDGSLMQDMSAGGLAQGGLIGRGLMTPAGGRSSVWSATGNAFRNSIWNYDQLQEWISKRPIWPS